MPQQKRAKRSGTVRWPNLEDDLADWIKEQRGKGMAVSTIINMDETPLAFDSPAKTVSVLTTGHERTSFTCVLACAANGFKEAEIISLDKETVNQEDECDDLEDLDLDQDLLNLFNSDSEESDFDGFI
ncbi:hypothetical protein X975_20025, partial [Stegodyphus mimosarum]